MTDSVCYRTLGLPDPASLKTYESIGGWKQWRKIVEQKVDPEEIIETLKQSDLRGRGGAGFPTGLKWSFIGRHVPGQKYVVCNSDESEPGTCKDREILRYNPHQLLEGLVIACYAMSATKGYNYIRGEYFEPFYAMEKALGEAYTAGLLGKNILGSDICCDLFNAHGAGAYICGEETALLNSLEGKRGTPRFKPPFPANYGLFGQPTTVNNTETLASVPVIMEKGAQWFSKQGVERNGGKKLFSVSGHVEKPGNYELPLGTPFAKLLELAGGVWKGRKLKAVIPGGSSAKILPADIMMDVNMDFDSLGKAGSMLGSGAVIVMDETTCIVRALERISYFYYEESCGQCTPCREGTGWLYRILHDIEHGRGHNGDLHKLKRIADNIEGHTICALGEAAAWPVQSYLQHFWDEFEYHIKHKKCLVSADQ